MIFFLTMLKTANHLWGKHFSLFGFRWNGFINCLISVNVLYL